MTHMLQRARRSYVRLIIVRGSRKQSHNSVGMGPPISHNLDAFFNPGKHTVHAGFRYLLPLDDSRCSNSLVGGCSRGHSSMAPLYSATYNRRTVLYSAGCLLSRGLIVA